MVQIKVKKLLDIAIVPHKAHLTDAGFDLFAAKDVEIGAGQTKLVPTGLAFELPVGYEMQVRPRSGVSLKTSAKVIFGTVDAGYRGEVGIIVHNESTNRIIKILEGDKIAQAIIQKIPDVEMVEVTELDEGERGINGFGSTGV